MRIVFEITRPDITIIGYAGVFTPWAHGALVVIGTAVGEIGSDRTFGDSCRGVCVPSSLQLAVGFTR